MSYRLHTGASLAHLYQPIPHSTDICAPYELATTWAPGPEPVNLRVACSRCMAKVDARLNARQPGTVAYAQALAVRVELSLLAATLDGAA